jgi:chromosome segregation ATPase
MLMDVLIGLADYVIHTWGLAATVVAVIVVVGAFVAWRWVANIGLSAQTQQTETQLMRDLVKRVDDYQRENTLLHQRLTAMELAEAKRVGSTEDAARQMHDLQVKVAALELELEQGKVIWAEAERRYRDEVIARELVVRESSQKDDLIKVLRQDIAVLQNELQLMRKRLADCDMDTQPLTKPKL